MKGETFFMLEFILKSRETLFFIEFCKYGNNFLMIILVYLVGSPCWLLGAYISWIVFLIGT